MKSTRNRLAFLVIALAAIGVAPGQVWDVEALDAERLLAAGWPCDLNDPSTPCPVVVDWTGAVQWSPLVPTTRPHSAQRLANGNTLIADTGNNRVIELNPGGWHRDDFWGAMPTRPA